MNEPNDARTGITANPASYNRPAPLDAPAGALIVSLLAAPEGDVLWPKEGDALWIARNAPMNVLLRAGDLLGIPYLDHYSQIALANEVTRTARGPAIAATAGSCLGRRDRELNAVSASPYTVTGWFTTNAGPTLHYTLEGPDRQVLDYWRRPDGAIGAKIEAGNHWLDLGEQDPRYQAVITGVREHEAANPDFAHYNNPQAGSPATTRGVQAGRSLDYPGPVPTAATVRAAARPPAGNQASQPAARRRP